MYSRVHVFLTLSCLVQELLRRNNSIAALTHVINELADADGHMHDAIQLEDLQLASYEALGWLTGSESGSHAVASEVIQSEAPGAVSALEKAIGRFGDNKRSKVIGLAALSWCRHQAALTEAGSAETETTQGEAHSETVKAVLDSLAESNNGDLQTLATLGFGWVSFSHPPSGLALLENKGVELMVAGTVPFPMTCQATCRRRSRSRSRSWMCHCCVAHVCWYM